MTADERHEFQQRCRGRWQRWQAELSWSKGLMTTWKPVMSERQKQEHDQYVKINNLPF